MSTYLIIQILKFNIAGKRPERNRYVCQNTIIESHHLMLFHECSPNRSKNPIPYLYPKCSAIIAALPEVIKCNY